MNVKELYGLYQYLDTALQKHTYTVYEYGVLTLYQKMLHGEVSRKDFLIFAIKDMMSYIEDNEIKDIKSTLMVKFRRVYINQKRE